MKELNGTDLEKVYKPTVIVAYHANCIDGYTAAWVAQKALTKQSCEVILFSMNYDDISYNSLLALVAAEEPVKVYVVDFSLPLEILKLLKGEEVTVLDHHRTAFERYAPEINFTKDGSLSMYVEGAYIVLDNTLSGAGICQVYFNSTDGVGVKCPELIAYVQDYDLWKFEYGDETKWVNKYLRSVEHSIAAWDHIAAMLETEEGNKEVLNEGRHLQEEHDKKVIDYTAEAAPCYIEDQVGLAVFCPYEFSSDVGNSLALKSGTFGACMQYKADKKVTNWSLRSVGDYDVSALAKLYGGGGHTNAAGFKVSIPAHVSPGYLPHIGLENSDA